MKTVNINLIESSIPFNNFYGQAKREDKIGESTKTLCKIIIISSSVLFIGCFAFWTYNISQMNGLKDKIKMIKSESISLELQYKELDSFGKALVKEREDLEQKINYKEKIDKDFLPWSKILSDLTRAIPQNIVIDEIKKEEKISDITGQQANYLSINGRISQSKAPLQSLSFFLLNLNENFVENTTLYNAKAGNIKYDEKEHVYSFDVETEIKLPNLQEKQAKVIG